MSPLFHRRSEEEKAAARVAAEERQAADTRSAEREVASLERVEQGRIPLAAAERLSAYATASGAPAAFSSDLGVDEWSLLGTLAITPITQVMGSSIFQVGWQRTYYTVPTEVRVLSDAYNECRRRALARLLEEAQACRADAVLGVRIGQGGHEFAPGAIEFIAVGTAVRLPERLRDPHGETVLSDLSGQEFVQLCNAGTRPVGIAAHTSIHYVPATAQTQMAQQRTFGSAWVNQELPDFSRGVYEAREKAIASVTSQVRELGGDGIIGVQVREHGRTHSVQRGLTESEDLEVSFHVIGTVVREDPAIAAQPPQPPPLKILSLS
jgi:uncharacterized protein YbjQ (UPF0145 family)